MHVSYLLIIGDVGVAEEEDLGLGEVTHVTERVQILFDAVEMAVGHDYFFARKVEFFQIRRVCAKVAVAAHGAEGDVWECLPERVCISDMIA